jgi:glycosyltransferase involved in cell wall biosynthesis
MASPEPRVSGAIPVRNGKAHLAGAIESMLAQTHPPAEIVVVDNGSTDGSRAIAERYAPQVRVIEEPREGIGPARNAALAAVGGDFLGFLDCDDRWEPRKTALQLAAFAEDSQLDIVFGHVEQELDEALDPALAAKLKVPEGPQPALVISAMLAPIEVWRRVGPWAGDFRVADMLDWLLRARRLGMREKMLPETVTRRGIHGANQSFANHADRSEWARLLQRKIAERRRARE